MRARVAEQKAQEILSTIGYQQLPIKVEEIVKKLNIELVRKDLPSEIHGALYVSGIERPIIIVNKSQSSRRIRFTIAHELGHYLLKHGAEMHVDKQILFRDERSSTAQDNAEIAANVFAAELLMPRELVFEKYSEFVKEVFKDDDALVSKLAEVFEVSSVAMGYRLKNLKLIVD